MAGPITTYPPRHTDGYPLPRSILKSNLKIQPCRVTITPTTPMSHQISHQSLPMHPGSSMHSNPSSVSAATMPRMEVPGVKDYTHVLLPGSSSQSSGPDQSRPGSFQNRALPDIPNGSEPIYEEVPPNPRPGSLPLPSSSTASVQPSAVITGLIKRAILHLSPFLVFLNGEAR